MRIPRAIPLCWMWGFVGLAHGAEFTQHEAHEHGNPKLTVVVDGKRLVIDLDIAAVNVVGFEHAPRTAQESAVVSAAVGTLGTTAKLYGFPPSAACRVEDASVSSPWQKVDGNHGEVHAEAHLDEAEHQDNAHEAGHEHADFEAHWTFQCESVPRWFEPWLYGVLPGLHQMTVQMVRSTDQTTIVVTSPKQRVPLQ